MNPHRPCPPLGPEHPIDPAPQGPYATTDEAPAPAGSAVTQRAALIYEAERKAQTEARDAWAERQRIEEAERRRRGVERMTHATNEYRDRRDQKDAER
jgi:hypothetical protein